MKKLLPDIGYTLIFGAISIILGAARFPVPGSGEIYTDLREVPLLIFIFYVRRPAFIILISLITWTTIFLYDDGVYSSPFFMHLVGLICTWYFYHAFIKGKTRGKATVVYWSGWIVIYYAVLVIPVMIFVDILFKDDVTPFMIVYPVVLSSLVFEYISTTMITVFYLLQLQTKEDLKRINLSLEDRITERTDALNKLNEELRASHEEIMKLNSNLEQQVIDRTAKLRIQLEKLNAYTFANSHEVRAPLARILGLLQLLELEQEVPKKQEIQTKMKVAAEELDQIIRKMNRILEAENLIDYHQDN